MKKYKVVAVQVFKEEMMVEANSMDEAKEKVYHDYYDYDTPVIDDDPTFLVLEEDDPFFDKVREEDNASLKWEE